MKAKFTFDELKKETLKLFTDYLGFAAGFTHQTENTPTTRGQSPDSYDGRAAGSQRKNLFSTRSPQ